MEFYSAEKNNGILKFAGKWMELEETILSEVTQSQIWYVLTHMWILDIKDYQPTIHTAREASKQEGP